jgi:DNA helicase-2/ATP-dependent DNA helicase PcrA
LLSTATLKAAEMDQRRNIRRAREATTELMGHWSNNGNPRFRDVLNRVARTGLFEIPESLIPFANVAQSDPKETKTGGTPPSIAKAGTDPILDAWDRFLQAPFAEVASHDNYLSGKAAFETRQGVKGLEFERVMVTTDDTESRGFMFKYEKLFGAQQKSKTDIENEREGKESGIDRAGRLFYVTCSRTESSLAIVAYSTDPEKVGGFALREGCFEENEVQIGI